MQRGRGERPADRLVQAAPDERVGRTATQLLSGREAAICAAACRQRRRQRVQAVDAGDLLDQVGLAGHVLAAHGRHRHVQSGPVHLRDLEVERAQDLGLTRARHRHPQNRLYALLAQADRLWRRTVGRGVDRSREHTRTAQLDHQARGKRLRVHALLGRKPLLEARGRLAAQAQRPGGAVDVGPAPVGDLHQHAFCLGLDLRALTAHDAGDRGRPLGVLDHDHLAVERARLPVERRHLLAVVGAPDRQLGAGDAIEVESVQRLCAQQHHVVGDVHHVVDRTLPGSGQACLQPRRRGRDRDVLEHARGEAGTEVGALDGHFERALPPRARGASSFSSSDDPRCRRVLAPRLAARATHPVAAC